MSLLDNINNFLGSALTWKSLNDKISTPSIDTANTVLYKGIGLLPYGNQAQGIIDKVAPVKGTTAYTDKYQTAEITKIEKNTTTKRKTTKRKKKYGKTSHSKTKSRRVRRKTRYA